MRCRFDNGALFGEKLFNYAGTGRSSASLAASAYRIVRLLFLCDAQVQLPVTATRGARAGRQLRALQKRRIHEATGVVAIHLVAHRMAVRGVDRLQLAVIANNAFSAGGRRTDDPRTSKGDRRDVGLHILVNCPT